MHIGGCSGNFCRFSEDPSSAGQSMGMLWAPFLAAGRPRCALAAATLRRGSEIANDLGELRLHLRDRHLQQVYTRRRSALRSAVGSELVAHAHPRSAFAEVRIAGLGVDLRSATRED